MRYWSGRQPALTSPARDCCTPREWELQRVRDGAAPVERHQPRRPTRPPLPVRPGDAALLRRRRRPSSTVSHELLNSKPSTRAAASLASVDCWIRRKAATNATSRRPEPAEAETTCRGVAYACQRFRPLSRAPWISATWRSAATRGLGTCYSRPAGRSGRRIQPGRWSRPLRHGTRALGDCRRLLRDARDSCRAGLGGGRRLPVHAYEQSRARGCLGDNPGAWIIVGSYGRWCGRPHLSGRGGTRALQSFCLA